MKILRKWLARLLCPQVFAEAERLHSLRNDISDIYFWCGEFEHMKAVALWLSQKDNNRGGIYSNLPAETYEHYDISSFREHFRRRSAA